MRTNLRDPVCLAQEQRPLVTDDCGSIGLTRLNGQSHQIVLRCGWRHDEAPNGAAQLRKTVLLAQHGKFVVAQRHVAVAAREKDGKTRSKSDLIASVRIHGFDES